jgi:hypothetical protein
VFVPVTASMSIIDRGRKQRCIATADAWVHFPSLQELAKSQLVKKMVHRRVCSRFPFSEGTRLYFLPSGSPIRFFRCRQKGRKENIDSNGIRPPSTGQPGISDFHMRMIPLTVSSETDDETIHDHQVFLIAEPPNGMSRLLTNRSRGGRRHGLSRGITLIPL